jgi:hypothetical protein
MRETTELVVRATCAKRPWRAAPYDLPVAIQTASGVVVDRLLAAAPGSAMHPNVFNAT